MEQITRFNSDQLQDAIELLDLDPRVYRLLKQAKLNRISSIILRGESQILHIKQMGAKRAETIFSSIAHHLGLSRQDLSSKRVIEAAVSCEHTPIDALRMPISNLALPLTILNALNSMGFFDIRDLLRLKMDNWEALELTGLHSHEIRKIIRELDLYLSQNKLDRPISRTLSPTPGSSVIDPNIVLLVVMGSERTARVIELRSNQLMTLEEICRQCGGITMEAVRHMIDKVLDRTQHNSGALMGMGDHLEERARKFVKEVDFENFTIGTLIDQLSQGLKTDARFPVSEKNLGMFVAIIRLLVINERPLFTDLKTRWKNLVDLSCFASPPITKHEAVSKYIEEQIENRRKLSYKEAALSVLKDEGKPMHWSTISERACQISHRNRFILASIYTALRDHPDLFFRVAPGTYALTEWGFKRSGKYSDIIASILKSQKEALPAEVIHQKVEDVRPVKQSTLTMLLNLNPRFYQSLEKTYGLRAWLASQEKQTTPVPDWLVEERTSYRRIETAKKRGTDVEKLIRADLETE
jgi:hypothetical protein